MTNDPLDVFRPDLLANHTVFVTGGGSGINLGVALAFARLGAAVGLCGRNEQRLADAAERLKQAGAKAVSTTPADVREPQAIEAALDASREALGDLDTLVCGAAGNFGATAEELTPNGFRSVVDIDLNGSFHSCQAAFDQLRSTDGSIIMISAPQAIAPYVGQAHVGAAKAGVEQLMRSLALEWGRYGIRANSIVPGPVSDTEGVRRLLPGDAADRAARIVPLGRLGQTTDIGAAAVYLASEAAAYVSGTSIEVDGGGGLAGSGLWNSLLAGTGKGG